jgi:hypothetical protein
MYIVKISQNRVILSQPVAYRMVSPAVKHCEERGKTQGSFPRRAIPKPDVPAIHLQERGETVRKELMKTTDLLYSFNRTKLYTMEIRVAQRQKAKIRLGLQGPSGSGKTYSALLLAYGLTGNWCKIVVIDTENHSADLYADLGEYRVLSLSRPFSPEAYIKAIEACESLAGADVIIIDSISHEWEGAGGILETHGNMTGNSFTNWNKVTPRHNAFVQKILQSRCHVIATIRSKQDYVLSEKNGKMVPEKVGLKGITREGMDYEFTIVLDLDIKHHATATKDRTGLFMDKPAFVIKDDTGQQILKWCNLGTGSGRKTLDSIRAEIDTATDVQQLRDIFNRYPQYQEQIRPLCAAAKKALELPEVIHSGPG